MGSNGRARRKVAITFSLICVVFPLTALLDAHAVASQGDVSLLSQSTWIDSIGEAHCVGEVQNNTGTGTVDFVRISENEYNASDGLIGTSSTYAQIEPLSPGTKSGFTDIFSPPAGFTHCMVAFISWDVGGNPNYYFSTQVTNVFSDTGGTHYVGTVTNNNVTQADFVRVNFTFYDGGGGANDADFTYVETGSSASLAPGQTASFEEIHLSGAPAVASYAVLTTSSSPPTHFSPQGVGAPQVALTPDGSTQLVFWQGAGGHLNEVWWHGRWNGPVDWTAANGWGTPLSSAPGVALAQDGTQLVFWEGPGGHLFEAWWNGGWNGPVDWTAANGWPPSLASAPNVTIAPDGTQLIFWRGANGHLIEVWWQGHWNGPVDWTAANGWGAPLNSAPSVALAPDGTQLVFWQGSGGHLIESWWQGHWNGPVDWTAANGWSASLASAPNVTITSDGTQLIFWRGAGGHLNEVWWQGHWNGPVDWTSANGWSAPLNSAPSVALAPDGTQLVFWEGPGAHLIEAWWQGHWNGPVDWSS